MPPPVVPVPVVAPPVVPVPVPEVPVVVSAEGGCDVVPVVWAYENAAGTKSIAKRVMRLIMRFDNNISK